MEKSGNKSLKIFRFLGYFELIWGVIFLYMSIIMYFWSRNSEHLKYLPSYISLLYTISYVFCILGGIGILKKIKFLIKSARYFSLVYIFLSLVLLAVYLPSPFNWGRPGILLTIAAILLGTFPFWGFVLILNHKNIKTIWI